MLGSGIAPIQQLLSAGTVIEPVPLSALIVPAISVGMLGIGVAIFVLAWLRFRDGLFLSIALIGLVSLAYVGLDLARLYIGGVRLQLQYALYLALAGELAITIMLVLLPALVAGLVPPGSWQEQINRPVLVLTAAASAAIILAGLINPELLSSVTEANPAGFRRATQYGIGRSGPLQPVRDLLVAVMFLYFLVVTIAPGRLDETDGNQGRGVYVLAAVLAMAFGLQGIYNNAFGTFLGPFADVTYSRVGVGLVLFSLIAMAGAIDRFVRQAAELRSVNQRLEENEQALMDVAFRDQLTGVGNRKAFMDRCAEELDAARRNGGALGLCYIDLDNFKGINDTFGHAVGDAVLLGVVRRMERSLRSSDTLFRLGGDEFTLLLTSINDPSDAGIVADKLIRSFREPIIASGRRLALSITVGIAMFPGDGRDVTELLQKADLALFSGKAERNTYRFFSSSMNKQANRRIQLVSALRDGIANGAFRMYYQPIVGPDTGLRGFEALMRWPGPDGNSPAEFIPAAEASGLIGELGSWALRQVMEDLRLLDGRGFSGFVSVNLSGRQLEDDRFVARLARLVHGYKVDPRRIHLEITETALVENRETAGTAIDALRLAGFRVAIDDFGTGYSSLEILRDIRVDTIKLDRSYVAGIGSSTIDEAIVIAVLDLARAMDLESIPEGVETPEQRAFLLNGGASMLQGYLYGPARPPEELLLVNESRA